MEIISSLLTKLSSYNILNYMIPGAVAFIFLVQVIGLKFIGTWPAYMICIFIYFIGMVCNRIGSLVIEPCYRKWRIVVYAQYSDFVRAEQVDKKLTVLNEINNSYKTYAATFFLLFLICIIYGLFVTKNLNSDWLKLLTIFALYVLFSLSFHKQTAYIRKRVNTILQKK